MSPWVLTSCAALTVFAAPGSAEGQMAVVVHPDVAVEDVSMEELRRWFRGQVITFSDGTRVQLVQNRDIGDAFFRALLDWSARRFKQHWIGVVFSGAEGTPPRDLDERGALELVARDRHAISFVRFQEIDESVRVLRVDGLWPNDPGYPLR